ncbi:MAG TPA: hypothetical protein VN903_02450 [Polyangia bacterium]|nr:hypothetical protein [Polyangia bacterium]
MRARQVAFAELLVTVLVTGACGGSSHPLPSKTEPHLIPGGGIADGPIHGTLNVYVIDEDTRNVVSSAAVRVGAGDEQDPCNALTDSTGLARFDSAATSTSTVDGGAPSGAGCKLLSKPVTLTVSATGHAPSTWIGVNGGNVTIALRAISMPDLGRATVSGTIAGWDDLPAPAVDHNRLAIIGASSNPALSDRANNIDQGTRSVDVDVLGVGVVSIDIASNVCVRNSNPDALVNDCNWILTTHTGAQAHFAILVDQDTKGTPDDDTDDTFTATGWAIKTSLSFGDGTMTGGEILQPIADADMQSFSASFASGPSGLDYVVGLPVLDLGTEGRINIILPALNKTTMMTRVPKLTGPLAGAHYDMIAVATDDATKAQPSTITWLRHVDPSSTVAVKTWLPPPTAIAMASGTFSFTPVTGATVHGAELQTMDGQRRWSITIFDDTTSFTLPGLSPDPLPIGTIRFAVSALRIPDANLKNIVFDDLRDVLTDISTDEITYTR